MPEKFSEDSLNELRTFMKMRLSLRDEPVAMYWSGEIYQHIAPEEATDLYPATGGFSKSDGLLFRMAGYSVARAYYDPLAPRRDGSKSPGYCTLMNELMLYLDPITMEVLETWENKMIPSNPDGTGHLVSKNVTVLPIQNTINMVLGPEMSSFYKYFPLDDERVVYPFRMMTNYPSPMAGDPKYARFSNNDNLQAVETMLSSVNLKELQDPNIHRVDDVQISFTRVGPYLPWMHMGKAPGRLVYIGIGHKTKNGFDGLPSWVKDYVRKKYPNFTAPPSGDFPGLGQTMNSWHVFKNMLDDGSYTPAIIP